MSVTAQDALGLLYGALHVLSAATWQPGVQWYMAKEGRLVGARSTRTLARTPRLVRRLAGPSPRAGFQGRQLQGWQGQGGHGQVLAALRARAASRLELHF